jgi:very-short-patch-repair endonuclease
MGIGARGSDMSEALKGRLVEAMQREVVPCCETLWRKLDGLCESPIEIALGAAILMGMQMACVGSNDAMLLCDQQEEEKNSNKFFFLFMPQYSWRSFRIDWVIKIEKLRQPYVFIECDGHDFHERTADQAARDRSRDRAIQEADIPVLRFTGREIYRDVQACAGQAMDMCVTLFDRHK